MKRTGPEYHAAGGAVRDLLLGRNFRDVDYVFTGTEEDFIQRNPSARKIEKQKTNLYLLIGQEFSILSASGEKESEFLEKDLARRDFTMNALLLSPDGFIRAHPLAFGDLRDRIIRPASPTAILDDPVRTLRAARFSAEFPDFTLHEDCLAQMRETSAKGLLHRIAPEQAGKELLKACRGSRPGNFLRTLAIAGCLSPWFKEFACGGQLPAGPPGFHDCTVLEHTALVMDAASALSAEGTATADEKLTPLAVWMAFCHDIGKTATPGDTLPRHIGHEARGRELARNIGERLRLPAIYITGGAISSELHMKGARYGILRPGTKVDLLMKVHAAHVAQAFFTVVAADSRQPSLALAMRADLNRILSASLPPQWRNLGARSGEYLRQMRCELLSTEN